MVPMQAKQRAFRYCSTRNSPKRTPNMPKICFHSHRTESHVLGVRQAFQRSKYCHSTVTMLKGLSQCVGATPIKRRIKGQTDGILTQRKSEFDVSYSVSTRCMLSDYGYLWLLCSGSRFLFLAQFLILIFSVQVTYFHWLATS